MLVHTLKIELYLVISIRLVYVYGRYLGVGDRVNSRTKTRVNKIVTNYQGDIAANESWCFATKSSHIFFRPADTEIMK